MEHRLCGTAYAGCYVLPSIPMNPLSPLPAILDQTKAHDMQPTLCAGCILRMVQTALMHISAPTATWALSLGRPALCAQKGTKYTSATQADHACSKLSIVKPDQCVDYATTTAPSHPSAWLHSHVRAAHLSRVCPKGWCVLRV